MVEQIARDLKTTRSLASRRERVQRNYDDVAFRKNSARSSQEQEG